MTAEHQGDLLDEFMRHYNASQTRPAIDRFLAGLRSLVTTPLTEQIDEC